MYAIKNPPRTIMEVFQMLPEGNVGRTYQWLDLYVTGTYTKTPAYYWEIVQDHVGLRRGK